MSIGKIHHRESNKLPSSAIFKVEPWVVGVFPCLLYLWFLSQDSTLAKVISRLLAAKSLLCYSPSYIWFSSYHSILLFVWNSFILCEEWKRKREKERRVSESSQFSPIRYDQESSSGYHAQQQAPSLSRPSCHPYCFYLHGHSQDFQNPKFLLVCPCLRTSLGQAIIPNLLSSIILLSLLVLFISWL